MFCKWCGKNISGNTVTICPSCGKEQGPLMSGNGFWDLCTIDPATGIAKVHPVSDVTDEEVSDICSHIEGNDEFLSGSEQVVSSNAIRKKGLPQCILKQHYVEFCLVIILFLNFLVGVLNLVCWPMLFMRQMEQHKADEKIYMEDGLSDIRNILNDIGKAHTEKKEAFASQSPQDVLKTAEIVASSEESDMSEEAELEESDATTMTDSDSATPKLTRYIVDEDEGLYLYAVEDIPKRMNNCSYYWQTSEDGGETWVPLSNGSRYVVISPKENEEYRVIVSSQIVYLLYFSS